VMVEVGAWDYVPKNSLGRLVPAIKRAMQRAALQDSRRAPAPESAVSPEGAPRPR
jgi:hypothetical protein